MIAAGLPIDRVTLHFGTLHPQLAAFAWNWQRSDGVCYEAKVQYAAQDTDSFKLNPLARIFATGEAIRRKPQQPGAEAEFPIMPSLAPIARCSVAKRSPWSAALLVSLAKLRDDGSMAIELCAP